MTDFRNQSFNFRVHGSVETSERTQVMSFALFVLIMYKDTSNMGINYYTWYILQYLVSLRKQNKKKNYFNVRSALYSF